MLMVLVVGITVLAHYQPFEEGLSQSMQVSRHGMCQSRVQGLLNALTVYANPESTQVSLHDMSCRS